MRDKMLVWSLLAFLVTMLLHGLIVARHFSSPNFLKYQLAARQYNTGELDKERIADFSPLYFHIHAIAQKWLHHPEKVILWFQVLLTAISASLLTRLLWLYFSPYLAMIGTLVFIFDRSIMVYESALEPESLLLFLLLAFAFFSTGSSRVTSP